MSQVSSNFFHLENSIKYESRSFKTDQIWLAMKNISPYFTYLKYSKDVSPLSDLTAEKLCLFFELWSLWCKAGQSNQGPYGPNVLRLSNRYYIRKNILNYIEFSDKIILLIILTSAARSYLGRARIWDDYLIITPGHPRTRFEGNESLDYYDRCICNWFQRKFRLLWPSNYRRQRHFSKNVAAFMITD